MSMIDLKDPAKASSASFVTLGLVGGWVLAKETGIRPLGGVVYAACGLLAGRSWRARNKPATVAALTAGYIAAFGLSHPLAKKIGAWPSVIGVTAASAGAAYALSDAKS